MEDETDIKVEDTVEFTFPIKGGRVIKCYDADTITIASKLPYKESPLYRLSVRLTGIDAPEIKGKSEEEKEIAKQARDFVSNLILNKYVRLENVESEKYGRILANMYSDEARTNCLNTELVSSGFAKAYFGDKKEAFSA
jgi:endonuclease YncB( thermonuclease family)